MGIFWTVVTFALVIGLPIFTIWVVAHAIHEDQRPHARF